MSVIRMSMIPGSDMASSAASAGRRSIMLRNDPRQARRLERAPALFRRSLARRGRGRGLLPVDVRIVDEATVVIGKARAIHDGYGNVRRQEFPVSAAARDRPVDVGLADVERP